MKLSLATPLRVMAVAAIVVGALSSVPARAADQGDAKPAPPPKTATEALALATTLHETASSVFGKAANNLDRRTAGRVHRLLAHAENEMKIARGRMASGGEDDAFPVAKSALRHLEQAVAMLPPQQGDEVKR